MMRKKFPLKISALEDIFQFVDDFAADHPLDTATRYAVDLAIEELFTNMVKYNQKDTGDTEITLDTKKRDLVISLTDFDVPPFDITKAATYNVKQSLSNRPIGRLGIHLIKKMMDRIDYTYRDKKSTITLVKHMGKLHVRD